MKRTDGSIIVNNGLDLTRERQEQNGTEFRFGAASPTCIALIPEDQRDSYLPVGELQRGLEDFMDCASRAPINKLEAKFTWLIENHKLSPENEMWLKMNGYVNALGRVELSDRFISILSDTGRQGNSLKGPLQTIHEFGVIPKPMFPASPDLTFDQYQNEKLISPQMLYLGRQFLSRFNINYDQVFEEQFVEALKNDMLIVAAFAWPQPVEGEYPRVAGNPNHAFVIYKTPEYYAFDNYEEGPGDFIKKLAPNYDFFSYGYRLYISENVLPKPIGKNGILDVLKRLFTFFKSLFTYEHPAVVAGTPFRRNCQSSG